MSKSTARLLVGILVGVGVGLLVAHFWGGPERAPKKPSNEADAPAPAPANPHNPHAMNPHGAGQAPAHSQADRAMASMAKAHFMKKFVAALTATPQNAHPNPEWSSPLKDPEAPIRCEDCHDPTRFNVEGMKSSDPGAEAVESFRKDPQFMIPLMKKWVARLNSRQGERLRGLVTCTTCHEKDPSQGEEDRQMRVLKYAYFMSTFVRALREPPTTNKEPAQNWKPLLAAPESTPVRCSTCHEGSSIADMDRVMETRFPRPAEEAADHEFMLDLMQKWVNKINETAKDKLNKTVECTDCHETDPRG